MFANDKLLQMCGDTFSEVINSTDIAQPVQQVNNSEARYLTLPEFDVIHDVRYHLVCSVYSKKFKLSNTTLVKCESCSSIMSSEKLRKIVTVLVKADPLGGESYTLDAIQSCSEYLWFRFIRC